MEDWMIAFKPIRYFTPLNYQVKTARNDFDEILEVPISTQPPPPPPRQFETFKLEVVDNVEIVEQIEINLDVELTEDMAVKDVVFDIPTEEIVEEKAEEIFQIVEDHP